MPERARAVVLASTGTGDIIPDATVTVRNPGTTTNISETIFANDDPDTTQLTNGVFKTDARGLAIFYLTNQKRVDVLFTKAGVTSVTIPVDVQKSTLVSGESVATSTIWDAKGDLAAGTGADAASRLAVGANDTALTADSAQATGLKWVAYQALSGKGAASGYAALDANTRVPLAQRGILTATFVWDPPSVAANSSTFDSVNVPGAEMGDLAIASYSGDLGARIFLSANVYTSTGDVRVNLHNPSTAAIDLASGTFRVMVVKL